MHAANRTGEEGEGGREASSRRILSGFLVTVFLKASSSLGKPCGRHDSLLIALRTVSTEGIYPCAIKV